jgi:hypothetical protein
VALDVRYHAAIGPYRTGTVVLPDGQLFGGMTVERTHIANLAIGGEYYVSPSWVVRGGLFTDLSAQPELVPIATQSGVERVNLFGFATSAGWISEKTTLTLTFTYAGGVGDVVGRVNGGTPEEAFVVSRAVRHQLGLLLGGAYAW